MITKFHIYENSNDLIPKFYIDLRNASDEEKMKALNILEKISKLRFNGYNGEGAKEKYITHRDSQGLAWCWRVEQERGWFDEGNNFYVSGIHTRNWGMPEIGEKMLTCKEFIETGPVNVEMFFTSNKYNL